MDSRTKTEDMPALRVEGAGEALLEESANYWLERLARNRSQYQQHDFTDDEPTVPMRAAAKEG